MKRRRKIKCRDLSPELLKLKIIATLLTRAFVRVGAPTLAITLVSALVSHILMLLSHKYPDKSAIISKINKIKTVLVFTVTMGQGLSTLRKYGAAGMKLANLFASFTALITIILNKAIGKLAKKIVNKV